MKVAFQGTKGAYSEIAIEKHCGKGAEAMGYPRFEEAFKAVKAYVWQNELEGLGLIPYQSRKIRPPPA